MKKAYITVLVVLSILVLSWFLPWLYSLVFPVGGSEPFVAFSPISNELIVSEIGNDAGNRIFAVDPDGNETGETFTKEQRDSLLPQIYFTQLMARDAMPDSICGKEASMQAIKHNQWVFSSIPHDVNKVFPEVNLIMESMPRRIDLEDPEEVFRFRDGRVEFIDMATNTVNGSRTRRFTELFNDRGFAQPAKSLSANITSRKPYDNGYLIVDTNGDIYHMLQQAGRPFLMKLRKPDSICAEHVFVMENGDRRFLGFMTDTAHRLYAIEQDGYRLVEMPVGAFDPENDRISVVRNLFNIVFKVSSGESTEWTAIDADTYKPLAAYERRRVQSESEKIMSYIFPFSLSFTSTGDCLVRPRFEDLSLSAVFLNVILAGIMCALLRRRKCRATYVAVASGMTLVLGIFAFIPFILIHNH